MLKRNILCTLTACFLSLISSHTYAKQTISLQLDWFVNPDHAAIIIAQQKGFFTQHGLDVEIIEPADPSMPPKLVAAGESDLAIGYQPQLYMDIDAGLPLVRIGTLIATPLNSLVVLKNSQINELSDLKGKKIGYSVSGFEDVLVDTMLKTVGLSKSDVKLININWSLSPSLMSGQVDAVIGALRNFELNQMILEDHPGFGFYPEEHGIPVYDELILLANKNKLNNPEYEEKLALFMEAIEQATLYISNNHEQAWEDFISYKPQELNNELNRMAWKDTLPRLSLSPRALDNHRYERMAKFMKEQGLIKSIPSLNDYARQLK